MGVNFARVLYVYYIVNFAAGGYFQPLNSSASTTLDNVKAEHNISSTFKQKDSVLGSNIDIVDEFLSQLDTYDPETCKPGTEASLGEGVVQQYGTSRFREQAELAVNRANLLTEIWKLKNHHLHNDESFFFSQVRNLILSDPEIYGAGNCYDEYEFKDYWLFCPFAHRTAENTVMVKDLSVEYPYIKSTDEFFINAKIKAEQLLPDRNVTITEQMPREHYTNGTPHHSPVLEDITILVTYEDGQWTAPYYDCGGGDIWMMTYTVPFFSFRNNVFKFKGTSGIDIDLRKVDIDQCDSSVASKEYNVFANSSKCLSQTTQCQPVRRLGFRRGSYKCVCKQGYYFPDTTLSPENRYFNGSDVEEQYHLYKKGEANSYTDFECLKCKEGCDTCEDDRPCIKEPNWLLRNWLLSISCIIMFAIVPGVAVSILLFKNITVIKAASPKLLCIVLIGSFLLYCPMIVMYFEATEFTCTLKIWFRELGFSISYGALLLKTWRISLVFRVRSATQVKITDTNLMKRLVIIVAFFVTFLALRTAIGRPTVTEGKHRGGLKVAECSFDTWDYVQAAGEYALLLWGIRLCIVVRKAPSEFNESKFISWAIYNEALLAIFFNLSMFLVRKIEYASGDILYIIHFAYTNLTTTVTLLFLFSSKALLAYKLARRQKNKRAHLTPNRSHQSNFKYASKTGTASVKEPNLIGDCRDETLIVS